jgi:ABC-type transport system substrate-binding protein
VRVIAALLFLSIACSPTVQTDPVSQAGQTNESAPRKTSAVLAVAATISSLSISFTGNGGGGGYAFTELYEQGLVTTGTTSTAPEPRIAAELPSLDKGTAQVMPDGKMRVTWKIRPEVRWADGVDLTARDYAFGFEVLKDPANPLGGATLGGQHRPARGLARSRGR